MSRRETEPWFATPRFANAASEVVECACVSEAEVRGRGCVRD